MQKLIAVGNLGQDPILRKTNSGIPVVNFPLATTDLRTTRDEEGNKSTTRETIWFNITAWGGQAELCAKHLKKGSLVSVEGKVIPRTYTDRDGTTHKTFEVEASSNYGVRFLSRSAETTVDTEETETTETASE